MTKICEANNSRTELSLPRRHRLNESLSFNHKKKGAVKITAPCGGKRGIRTPGASQLIGFQDRRIRPLCHLSRDKGTTFFRFCKIFREKLNLPLFILLKKLNFRAIFYNFVGWKGSLIVGAVQKEFIGTILSARGNKFTNKIKKEKKYGKSF